MNVISAAGRRLSVPPVVAPTVARVANSAAAATSGARSAPGLASTPAAGSTDTYADPRITSRTVLRPIGNLWAVPTRSGDAISSLMANNHSTRFYNLAEQWRGLGGALLRHLGATGEGYSQTRVNDPASSDDPAEIAALPPERLAQHMAALAAAQAAALAGVGDQAASAELQLKLASGRTVQLRLVDSTGFGPIGMQASIAASGTLSDAERAAVQALADGLDRAVAGLGQPDVARLDLAGLLGYDRRVITGLDLTVDDTPHGNALRRFELHMGGEKPSLLLQGVEGEMRLSVDATGAARAAPAAPRAEALRSLLARVDTAGQRGQANAALVEQMKSALAQMQTAVAAASPARAVAGGLADFEASFSGDTWRLNGAGTMNQAGRVAYQLSQKTEGGPGAVRQTVSEQLSADFKQAPGGRMLHVDNGNYTATQVRDRSTVTTLIKSVAGGAGQASRQADEHQLKTSTRFEGGRVVSRQVWPGPPASVP